VIGPSGFAGYRELDIQGALWSLLAGAGATKSSSGRLRLEDVLCALRAALAVEDSDARSRAALALTCEPIDIVAAAAAEAAATGRGENGPDEAMAAARAKARADTESLLLQVTLAAADTLH
jgi:hypothetical protein